MGYRLMIVGCREVLGKKQSGYKDVLAWLDGKEREILAERGMGHRDLERIVER